MFDPTTSHSNQPGASTIDRLLNEAHNGISSFADGKNSYAIPVHRIELALKSDKDITLNLKRRKIHPEFEQSDYLTEDCLKLLKSTQSSTSLNEKHLKVNKKGKAVLRGDRDFLTGLSATQSIVANPKNASLSSSSFNSAYGYGLVNAAKAVAWSAGYYPYALNEVADLGGFNWNNDLVKAPEAWSWGAKGQGIKVAVIDSGVDIAHSDLNGNIWRNTREIAGDGIDNDRNGYVDDIYGWNFGTGQNNNNVLPGTNDPGQVHGTHVAGTIAAMENSFGTTGVAPEAKIMAIRMGNIQTNRDGTTSFTNSGSLAEAIRYAVNNGAKVINMSLSFPETPEIVSALAYAANNNVITVSSSGNNQAASPSFPAKYATVYGIAVGAIDANGRVASFSNGAGQDSRTQFVAAPGVDIWSTTPSSNYAKMSGTSMASPHVAGVIALMLSANPNLTYAQIRYILTASATG